jgi:predicted permease
MIAAVVPVFNILAVIALEMFQSGKINFTKIIVNICKNPLIIGTLLGVLCSATRFDAPQVLRRSLSSLTACASPVALIVLGGTFRRQSLGENKKLLTELAALRLAIVPGILLGIALLLGFRDVELLSFITLFGSPAAVSSFSMAQQMGGDSELAGQNLLITTVFSIFTIFIWVSLLNYFSFIS